jgi:hypothetical protein
MLTTDGGVRGNWESHLPHLQLATLPTQPLHDMRERIALSLENRVLGYRMMTGFALCNSRGRDGLGKPGLREQRRSMSLARATYWTIEGRIEIARRAQNKRAIWHQPNTRMRSWGCPGEAAH